jgi:hypothetical protein
MKPEAFMEIDKITGQLQDYSRKMQQFWKENVLFTWQWWLLALLTVVPWICWAFYSKKESRSRLLFSGFFAIIISKLMDAIGSTFGLWIYPARVVPLMPPYLPWDTTLMPVIIMILLQFKPKIHPVIKAVVFGTVAAFVIEPLAQWLGLYKPLVWKHIYSLPIFIAIYIAADWLSRRKGFDRLD